MHLFPGLILYLLSINEKFANVKSRLSHHVYFIHMHISLFRHFIVLLVLYLMELFTNIVKVFMTVCFNLQYELPLLGEEYSFVQIELLIIIRYRIEVYLFQFVYKILLYNLFCNFLVKVYIMIKSFYFVDTFRNEFKWYHLKP